MNDLARFVLAATLVVSTVAPTLAQSCNSATQVVSSLRQEIHRVYESAGCMAVRSLESAEEGESIAARRDRHLAVNEECLEWATGNWSSLGSQMVSFWNQQANNSWATVGPRRLDLDMSPQSGTVIGTTGRMFVSSIPMSQPRVRLRLEEQSGRGKARAVVCRVDADGNTFQIGDFTFNDDRDAKRDRDEAWTPLITGVRDHFVTVHIDGKSVANRFGYSVDLVDP